MFSTNKELYIYLEQCVQQVTANRHRSLSPEFFDMVLNSTMDEYIDAKSNYKTNGSNTGFEQDTQRMDVFSSLKKNTPKLQTFYDGVDTSFIFLPSDYKRWVSANVTVFFSKDQSKLETSGTLSYIYTIVDLSNMNFLTPEQADGVTSATIQLILGGGVSPTIVTVDITKLIPYITQSDDEEGADTFEFVNALKSIFEQYGVTAYWERFDNTYYPKSFILTYNRERISFNPNISIGDTTFNLGFTQREVTASYVTFLNPNTILINGKNRDLDILPSEQVSAIQNNYYENRNRHINPYSEIVGDRLIMYNGNRFRINDVTLTYYKEPRLFMNGINQMSDITITTEYLTMVEAKIKLMLKDDTFQFTKQISNTN